ncbi:MAG: xylulokinase [Pseudomonadota bacterium]
MLPGYTASKVLWFRQQHRDLYDRMRHILLPHDYLNFALTGEFCMEAGDASGTGFFDVRERRWSTALLGAIDPDRDLGAALPAVRTGNTAVGALLPSMAASLGLPAAVPVAIGGGDNMMGAIGSGNVRPGALTISLGTSGTVYAYADGPIVDPKGQIAAFCSSTGGWLPLLCTMNCTVSTELIRDLVGADLAAFESQVADAPAGAAGLLTLPFFNGERTPNLPAGKGVVLGIEGRNATPANLLRSAMEGATFALKFGIDELAALGIRATEIALIGGGAHSASWRALAADVFGLPVRVPEQEEGPAFGAALQALDLLTDQSLADIAASHVRFDAALDRVPDERNLALYADIYAEYQRAVGAVSPLYVS